MMMRKWFLPVVAVAWLMFSVSPVGAIEGALGIHDPSTVIICDGRYYVFGTGGGISVLDSEDGFTWRRRGKVFDKIPDALRAAVPKNNGIGVWAPEVIENNGLYYLYYSVSAWGQYVSAIGLMTSPTLDPASPKYKWTDCGVVVQSSEGDGQNDIDPGVVKSPDGTMWLCYGSYHGHIELVQLDPKTGLRIFPKSQVWTISNKSEASNIIFHDGYYYLFVNHGSCCKGKDSTYRICVGRSAKVTGPYLDRNGADLMTVEGTSFLASAGNQFGPGQFGRLMVDGVEKFSCHYEADLDSPSARSCLDIRPLLWTADGWPKPGQNLKEGTYQIVSKKTGKDLTPDHQKWLIAPAGGGYYKVTAVGGAGALQSDAGAANAKQDTAVFIKIAEKSPGNADNQLWKIDQCTDGSYWLRSKVTGLALTVSTGPDAGHQFLARAFSGDDAQKWTISVP